jgi:hypothetical protein
MKVDPTAAAMPALPEPSPETYPFYGANQMHAYAREYALMEREAAQGEGLRADFARALPSGMDDSTYQQIEDALDRAEAPTQDGGRWLTLAERVAALAPPVSAAPAGEGWTPPRCFVSLNILAGAKPSFGEPYDHPRGSFIRWEDFVTYRKRGPRASAMDGDYSKDPRALAEWLRIHFRGNWPTPEFGWIHTMLAAPAPTQPAAGDELIAAARDVADFAWRAMSADCMEAAEECNARLERLRRALPALTPTQEPQA